MPNLSSLHCCRSQKPFFSLICSQLADNKKWNLIEISVQPNEMVRCLVFVIALQPTICAGFVYLLIHTSPALIFERWKWKNWIMTQWKDERRQSEHTVSNRLIQRISLFLSVCLQPSHLCHLFNQFSSVHSWLHMKSQFKMINFGSFHLVFIPFLFSDCEVLFHIVTDKQNARDVSIKIGLPTKLAITRSDLTISSRLKVQTHRHRPNQTYTGAHVHTHLNFSTFC